MNFKKLYTYLYVSFFIIMPLVYFRNIIDPVLLTRQLFLSIFLLVLFIFLVIDKALNKAKLKVPIELLSIFLLIFVILNFVSAVYAINSIESIYISGKILVEFVFFITSVFLIYNDLIEFKIVLKSIIALGSIIVFVGIIQIVNKLILNHHDFWNQIHLIKSTMANKNLFSSVLFLIIPFLFFAKDLNRFWKRSSFIILFLCLSIIVILQARAVWIAILLSTLIFSISCFYNAKKYNLKIENNIRNFVLIFCGLLGLFILATIIITISKYVSPNSESFQFANNTSTFHTRFLLIKKSLLMIRENFVFGVGAGNWKIMFPKYGLSEFNPDVGNGVQNYIRPHNDFLWVFSELGILGIILFCSILFIPIFYLIKLLNINKLNGLEDYTLYFFLLAFIIGYMFILAVDFAFERIVHQVLIFFLFAYISSTYAKTHPLNICYNLKIPFLIPLGSIFIIFSLIVSIYRINGEKHARNIYKYHKLGDWEKMKHEAIKTLNPFYNMDMYATPIYWYKGVSEFSPDNIEKAKKSFEKAYTAHPYNVHVLNNLASCYEKTGNHDKAIQLYNELLIISPKFAEAILNLSAVYFNSNQYQKAFETISNYPNETNNERYESYLITVLSAYINEMILRDEVDKNIRLKLKGIQNNTDLLISYYREAKKEGIDFKSFILNNN